MTDPIYYAAHRQSDPTDGAAWVDYLRWLGRSDLQRVVTLDGMPCPPAVESQQDKEWHYAVQADFMLDFVTDLAFVHRQAAHQPRTRALATARDPSAQTVADFALDRFELAGCDIIDKEHSSSALLNCGGFPELCAAAELPAASGLILDHARACAIRDELRRLYPHGNHTDCSVWAIWRWVG